MLNKIKPFLPFIHFYVIVLCLFFQALTFGEAYRAFAYLNLILVFISTISFRQGRFVQQPGLLTALSVFLLFVVWEWLVTVNFSFIVKPLRHLLLAAGLLVAIPSLYQHHEKIKPKLIGTLIGLTYAYALCQMLAVYVLDRPFGTTKNPHYLAIYSAIFLVVSLWMMVKTNALLHRCMLSVSAITLSTLLLYTSSRPVWIALLIAIVILAVCLRGRSAFILLLSSSLLFVVLALTNAGNFKARWEDLIMHADTEERVTIWQDAWQMQKSNSTNMQWMLGHGFESFEADFTNYSRYYKNEHIDFNSPHNIVIELLYQFGFIGVILILLAVGLLYQKIISAYFKCRTYCQHAWVYLLLLMLLTVDFFGVSIILPFFISTNVNFLAIILSVTLYLNSLEKR